MTCGFAGAPKKPRTEQEVAALIAEIDALDDEIFDARSEPADSLTFSDVQIAETSVSVNQGARAPELCFSDIEPVAMMTPASMISTGPRFNHTLLLEEGEELVIQNIRAKSLPKRLLKHGFLQSDLDTCLSLISESYTLTPLSRALESLDSNKPICKSTAQFAVMLQDCATIIKDIQVSMTDGVSQGITGTICHELAQRLNCKLVFGVILVLSKVTFINTPNKGWHACILEKHLRDIYCYQGD